MNPAQSQVTVLRFVPIKEVLPPLRGSLERQRRADPSLCSGSGRWHGPLRSGRPKGERRHPPVKAAARETTAAVAADPPARPARPQYEYGPVAKWICLIGSIIGVILGLWRFFQDRITTKADVARQLTEAENSKAYEMALARARQAIFVEKAVGFMNIGSPARAMVELDRALKANAICRSPLLNSRYSKYEFENLYRLYIRNTDVPPDFAHLLQLREMLDIEDSDAEEIETLVMERPPPVGL